VSWTPEKETTSGTEIVPHPKNLTILHLFHITGTCPGKIPSDDSTAAVTSKSRPWKLNSIADQLRGPTFYIIVRQSVSSMLQCMNKKVLRRSEGNRRGKNFDTCRS
jgi:hypothetical protein